MNDYKLINALLEDGSQQAILKLKMVVDLEYFFIIEVNDNYRFDCAVYFKDYYEKVFSKKENLYKISLFPEHKRIEVFNLFLDSFKKWIIKSDLKSFINRFHEKDQQYIKDVFRNLSLS